MSQRIFVNTLPDAARLAELLPDLPPLGRNIRMYRTLRGWTQAALAARVHTTADYVRQLERGYAEPRWEMLKRLAAALDMSVSELTEGL